MDNTLTIKRADNGYVLDYYTDFDDDDRDYVVKVIEEDTLNERHALKALLHEVARHFGYQDDDYANNNLNIGFNKRGRKAE